MPPKIYLDEDVQAYVAEALRLRGWSAITTEEAGRRQATDRDQIQFATDNGFALLTYNVRDFPRIHYEMMARGEEHAGLLVATQDDPSRTVRILLKIVSSISAEDLQNQLLYLKNWE